MDQFWWGVVVALAVNLAAAYLKPRLDIWLSQTSSWWHSRSKARIAAQKQVLDELRDPDKQMVALVKGIVTGFASVQFFAITVLFMLMYSDMPWREVGGWHHVLKHLTAGCAVICFTISFRAFLDFHGGLETLQKAVEAKIHDRENPLVEPSSSVPPTGPR